MKGLDRTVLKYIAMGSMLMDHIGYVFFIDGKTMLLAQLYTVFHAVGRLAFPLFMYLLVDGFFRTRSKEKFFLRLFIMAIVSEVPFDLLVNRTVLSFSRQNVMWTLLIVFGYMWAEEVFSKTCENRNIFSKAKWMMIVIRVFMAIVAVLAGIFFFVDYQRYGVLCGIIMYTYKKLSKTMPTVMYMPSEFFGFLIALIIMILIDEIEFFALPDLLLVWFYKGKALKKNPKWFGYAFYPGHLLILAGLRELIERGPDLFF